jgi:FkbM family methyltransferase
MRELAEAISVQALVQRLADRYGALKNGVPQELAILGAAGEGIRLAALCHQQGVRVAMIVDDNPARHGEIVEGSAVVPSTALDGCDKRLPIVIASHRLLGGVTRLQDAGFESVIPFAVLQILAPDKFPPHMFYDGLIEQLFQNRDRCRELRDSLGDETSRRVLDAVVGFRLTLDPRILEPIIDHDLYGPDCLMPFAENEVYVDGGSYDGDSLRMFIDRVKGRYDRIYAYEPDQRTFERLTQNFSGEDRVVPVAKGLFREEMTLRFDDAGTRGSLFTDTGSVTVPVTSLDKDLQGSRASFIKMNIEGAEIDALEGARTTIRSFAPKLAISAYHRPSDLWEVPAKIKSLHPDYRLFLRQQDGGIIETVCYATR